MILVPIFLVLFACWMLWGWSVGESKNIKWLRQWCAPTFVVTALIIAAGAGAFVSRVVTRNQIREDVAKLIENIDLRVRTGGMDMVIKEIESANPSDHPDRSSFDLLDHLPNINKNLSPKVAEVAEQTGVVRAY